MMELAKRQVLLGSAIEQSAEFILSLGSYLVSDQTD